MTKEELIKKIDELETRKFFLAMKDRWNWEDFQTDKKLFNEIEKLKKELKKN